MTALLRHILLLLCLTVATAGQSAERTWEEVDRAPVQSTGQHVDPSDASTQEAEITVADGYVYVTLRQRTNVKIFTILGQLIVQDNLAPGVYRFRLSARGIYLLKAGSVTRRVTL